MDQYEQDKIVGNNHIACICMCWCICVCVCERNNDRERQRERYREREGYLGGRKIELLKLRFKEFILNCYLYFFL